MGLLISYSRIQRLWTPWPLELIVYFNATTDGHLFRYEHINTSPQVGFNPLNAELNPICHLLALLGCAPTVVVSRLRVKAMVGPMQNIIFDTPHMIPIKKNVLQFDSSNNLFAH